eukprot:gene35915-43563_t
MTTRVQNRPSVAEDRSPAEKKAAQKIINLLYNYIAMAEASQQKGKPLFDYSAQAANQINLKAGEIITIVNYGGKGSWSKGVEVATGKVGYFPSDYVELIAEVKVAPPQPPPPPRPASVKAPVVRARALFDFPGTGKGEMPLKRGDIVEVTLKGAKGGWCKGLAGAFPTDYVEFLPDTGAVGGGSLLDLSSPSSAVAAASSAPLQPQKRPSMAPVAQTSHDPFADIPVATGAATGSSAAAAKAPTTDLLGLVMDAKPVSNVAATPQKATTNASLLDLSFTPTVSTTVSKPVQTPTASVASTAHSTASSLPSVTPTTTAGGAKVFVNPVRATTPTSETPKPVEPKVPAVLATAKYTRDAAGPNELSITVGEKLLVRDTAAKEWWYGSSVRTGKAGYFPANYVEVVKDPENAGSGAEESKKSDLKPAPPPAKATASGSTASGAAVQQAQTARVDKFEALSRPLTEIKDMADELPPPCRKAGLVGSRYVYNKLNGSENTPSWKTQFFVDFFTEPYTFFNKDDALKLPSIDRLKWCLECVITASKMVDAGVELQNESQRTVFHKVLGAFKDAQDILRVLPPRTDDAVRFYTFLVSFVVRVRTLRVKEYLLLPVLWVDEQDLEHCILCLVTKHTEETYCNYSLTIVNASTTINSGLEYHPPSIDTITGEVRRKLSITFRNIPDDRIQNTAFWYLFFRPAVCNVRSDAKFVYEKIFPFLSDMHALSAVQAELQDPRNADDFRSLPQNGDSSLVYALFECARVIAKNDGMEPIEAQHFAVVMKMNMFKIALNDLFAQPVLSTGEKKILEIALKNFCTSVGQYAVQSPSVDAQLVSDSMALADAMEMHMRAIDESAVAMPQFETGASEFFNTALELDNFGRLRRDISVEKLAGVSQPPPILRPVEMTLVPDKVSHFLDMTKAMRHCLNLCVLLSNQRTLIRNSYTLRLCLIEHLFVRVIP